MRPPRAVGCGKSLATLPSTPSSRSGSAVITGRTCALTLDLRGKHGAVAQSLGSGSDGNVIYARGDVTGPDGETLHTGDLLCTGERGAGYTFPAEALESAGVAPPTQSPRYDGYFGAVMRTLEKDLKLNVGPTGALWFGIGTFGSEISNPFTPGANGTVIKHAGAGEPVTGGVIDVPAADIHVVGAVSARRLVLGLGHGNAVTLTPPERAPAAFFPPGENPNAGRLDLQTVTRNPLPELPLTGFAAFVSTRVTVTGASTFNRGVLGANGSVDLQGGITGTGAIIARGDITVRGKIDLTTDGISTFVSLGTVFLLGR